MSMSMRPTVKSNQIKSPDIVDQHSRQISIPLANHGRTILVDRLHDQLAEEVEVGLGAPRDPVLEPPGVYHCNREGPGDEDDA